MDSISYDWWIPFSILLDNIERNSFDTRLKLKIFWMCYNYSSIYYVRLSLDEGISLWISPPILAFRSITHFLHYKLSRLHEIHSMNNLRRCLRILNKWWSSTLNNKCFLYQRCSILYWCYFCRHLILIILIIFKSRWFDYSSSQPVQCNDKIVREWLLAVARSISARRSMTRTPMIIPTMLYLDLR